MRIFNTLTKKIEEFVPIKKKRLKCMFAGQQFMIKYT